MQPCVYILSTGPKGTLYIGVTSSLIQRVWQHKNNVIPGFTAQYQVHRLVWYEQRQTMHSAIAREKALKKWRRQWKINLIQQHNPWWHDLYPTLN